MKKKTPGVEREARLELPTRWDVNVLLLDRRFPSMTRLWSMIAGIPRQVLIGVVRGYQLFISPLSSSTCRFQPTCSAYAIEALRRYGFWKGLVLAVYRLGRCHPWGGHGYDPPRWFGEARFEEPSPEESGIEEPRSCTSRTEEIDGHAPGTATPNRAPASRDEGRSDATSERTPALSESTPVSPNSTADTQSSNR